MKDEKTNSWMFDLMKVLTTSLEEGRSSTEDEALHPGACHCRSVMFEVSNLAFIV